jgi:hypothetical protein
VLAYRFVERVTVSATTPASEQGSALQVTDTQRRVLIALCRPYRDGGRFATPASNTEIAAELVVTVEAVKTQMRLLFAKFDLVDAPQTEKRVRLAEAVMERGVIGPHELG